MQKHDKFVNRPYVSSPLFLSYVFVGLVILSKNIPEDIFLRYLFQECDKHPTCRVRLVRNKCQN